MSELRFDTFSEYEKEIDRLERLLSIRVIAPNNFNVSLWQLARFMENAPIFDVGRVSGILFARTCGAIFLCYEPRS